MDIFDLHCDLLAYLALSPDRDPYHPSIRCSAPQLNDGNVKRQVLAISSETGIYSLLMGLKQLEIFLSLSHQYPVDFPKKRILPAFENASCFALETEPLDTVFKRLEQILKKIHPLYISLTWNGENRFGGGCGSQKGLKEDGKELLRFLSKTGIAIDFSHTSDLLAYDIFDLIDQEGLDLPVMASHSNFRSVVDNIRNLPDPIAKEIINRKGLIGLVFYSKFLGSPQKLIDMVQYGLDLGGQNALAFGADFFCLDDLTALLLHGGSFFQELADSGCYQSALAMLKQEGSYSQELLEAISSKNAELFIAAKYEETSL